MPSHQASDMGTGDLAQTLMLTQQALCWMDFSNRATFSSHQLWKSGWLYPPGTYAIPMDSRLSHEENKNYLHLKNRRQEPCQTSHSINKGVLLTTKNYLVLSVCKCWVRVMGLSGHFHINNCHSSLNSESLKLNHLKFSNCYGVMGIPH